MQGNPEILLNRIRLWITRTGGDQDMMMLLDKFHVFYAKCVTSSQHILPSRHDQDGRSEIIMLVIDYEKHAGYEGPGGSIGFASICAVLDGNNER